jgi:hypothetical protein
MPQTLRAYDDDTCGHATRLDQESADISAYCQTIHVHGWMM